MQVYKEMKSFVFSSGSAVSKIRTSILSSKIGRKMRSENNYWGLHIKSTKSEKKVAEWLRRKDWGKRSVLMLFKDNIVI